MVKTVPQLGKQPPRHDFFLNPYPDDRFTTCPGCGRKTRLRKLPLVIHIDPAQLLSLNKTCRYCPHCDLLIVHQDELEQFLATYFGQTKPDVVGNDYLVIGTVDRANWKQGMQGEKSIQQMLDELHDFKKVLRFQPAGRWGPA
jgi:hypothetical protein